MSRQLYHRVPPRSPREYTCERCETKFLHRGCGKPKYCIDCRDIVITEHSYGITDRIKVGAK